MSIDNERNEAEIDIESGLPRDSNATISTTSTSKSNTWPEWVTNIHLVIITLMFVGGLLGSSAFALFPYFRKTNDDKVDYQYKPQTGFRTWTVLLHAAINCIVFCSPYFIFYKRYATKKIKGERISESQRVPMQNLNVLNAGDENKSFAERKYYYSYAINDGYGHQIATLGVSVSNIIFAMIVLIRYNFFHPENIQKIFPNMTSIKLDYNAITLAFFFGLSTRIFASGVPTFNVKSFPKAHYAFTGLMFLTMGIYMTIEVALIDPLWTQQAVHYCVLLRRACCLSYWFNFVGIILFGEPKLLNLSALSSICELLALLVQEIYILSYIISFRRFDGATSFMISHLHHH